MGLFLTSFSSLPGERLQSIIMSRNYLSKNDELRKGDYLISNNREWKAIFQEDGNFVIYGWKPMWSSDTADMDVHRLCMQADCNLVMYNQEGEPRWQANCCKDKPNMCRMHLTDEGVLLVEREAKEIWSSAKSQGMK